MRNAIPISLLILSAFLPYGGLRAQEEFVLPEDKKPVELQPGERNPFARRGPATETTFVEEDTESEESKLRAILEAMKVSGFTRSDNGNSVLLGYLRLEPGMLLPPLRENQTEQLRVVSIDEQQVELLFVDPPERQLNRTIRLRFDPRPRVRYMLGTQIPQPATEPGFQGLFPQPQPRDDAEQRQ